ncbi:MAG: Hpt domain-containing protein [Gammaproteobacteria bacterium]|nr:Hpt domain-containing protein [Gammaproteobacteria bacterium]
MILSEDTTRELQDLLGDGFAELVDTYVADAALHVQALEKLLQQGDSSAMEQPAHALKGSSANIGAMALMEAASTLVKQCRSGKVDNPAAAVANIRACYEQLVPLLVKLR